LSSSRIESTWNACTGVHDGSYPEDQEHEGDETFVHSSLSIDEVVAGIAKDTQGSLVDLLGDEDEGIDGFGREDSRSPACVLEPFGVRIATSYWPRWNGHAAST
jgi:hypothetical protein